MRRPTFNRTLRFLVLLGSATLPAMAQPMVHHIEYVTPRAAQQGTTVDVTLEGTYIKDAREVVFFEPGIRCIGITPLPSLPKPRNTIHSGYVQDMVQLRFEIAKDAPVGLHTFKVRTDTELTTLTSFAVTKFPVVMEGEEKPGLNDTLKTAKPVAPNTSVLGRMDSGAVGDIDIYRVPGKAGQHLSVEIDAVRLSEHFYGGSEYDLAARILDPDGHELAANDDSALHLQDPIVSAILPRDGDYFVEVKQRIFNPGANLYYLAHIGTNRRPLAAYPAGGPAGQPLTTTLLGDPAGPVTKTVQLPAKGTDFDFFDDAPSPLPMRVSPYANVLENGGQTKVPALPAALNGIISTPGKTDTFRVSVKKGQRWRVEVFARSLGSPLDARLVIRKAGDEKIEVEGDDATLAARGLYAMSAQLQRPEQMDPAFVWEPKSDGEYVLSMTDMRGFASPTSVYRVEIEPVRDEISTFFQAKVTDSVETPRLTSIAIPRGNRWTVTVSLAEGLGNRFKGELELVAEGLPKGVRMVAPKIPAGAKQAQAEFIADADTPPQTALVSLAVRPTDKSQAQLVSYTQQSFPFLNHSGGHAWHAIVLDKYALAVTEPAPFSFEVEAPQLPISKNGQLALNVKVKREPGFNGPVEFQCDYMPPGVQCEPTVTIPEGKSESVMHLTADTNVKPGTWPLSMTANTTGGSYYIGGGRIRAAADFVNLNVADPYVELKNKPASVRRRGQSRVTWDVDNKKPFDGEADAVLLGLPKGVSVVGKPHLKSGDKTLVFDIAATDDALLGRYTEVTCEVIFKQGGQEIRQRSGKGILRVDPALTATATKE